MKEGHYSEVEDVQSMPAEKKAPVYERSEPSHRTARDRFRFELLRAIAECESLGHSSDYKEKLMNALAWHDSV